MSSLIRYLGEPKHSQWRTRMERFLYVAGIRLTNQCTRQACGWQIEVSASADQDPRGPLLQVVTTYAFEYVEYVGVQGMVAIVASVHEDVGPRLERLLRNEGFFPVGSPEERVIFERLAFAGFTARNSFGQDLVHPTFLTQVFPMKEGELL